ncbi:MAG: TIGR04086 family membrane protein [Christensenellales bacterium]|jgi:putative membrane protein (TIGR04086 family)
MKGKGKKGASTAAGPQNEKVKGAVQMAIGVLAAAVVTLLLVLFFAMLVKQAKWSDQVIAPVNVAIKILSIMAGVYWCARYGNFTSGWLRGMIIGAAYAVVGTLIYMISYRSPIMAGSFFSDLAMCAAAGSFFGIIMANVKAKRRR